MIGCLRTLVRKKPIIALYFEYENALKFYNIEARTDKHVMSYLDSSCLMLQCYFSNNYLTMSILRINTEDYNNMQNHKPYKVKQILINQLTIFEN